MCVKRKDYQPEICMPLLEFFHYLVSISSKLVIVTKDLIKGLIVHRYAYRQ